jgi:hypothetical protein
MTEIVRASLGLPILQMGPQFQNYKHVLVIEYWNLIFYNSPLLHHTITPVDFRMKEKRQPPIRWWLKSGPSEPGFFILHYWKTVVWAEKQQPFSRIDDGIVQISRMSRVN